MIGRQCHLEVAITEANCNPLEDILLQKDGWDLSFICGLPLIRHNRTAKIPLQVLAAPVMLGDRYQNQPTYFADVVVNAASNLKKFSDLKGTRFCYNDTGSNSGYNLLRYRLLRYLQANHLDYSQHRFFETAQQSSSHQRSLQWIANGLADCAAIDSIVMEAELRRNPELSQSFRIIESIPSPMPPIAVSSRLETNTIEQIRQVLLNPDLELQAAMTSAQVSHYVEVSAIDYEPIAIAYDAAIGVGYEAIA